MDRWSRVDAPGGAGRRRRLPARDETRGGAADRTRYPPRRDRADRPVSRARRLVALLQAPRRTAQARAEDRGRDRARARRVSVGRVAACPGAGEMTRRRAPTRATDQT